MCGFIFSVYCVTKIFLSLSGTTGSERGLTFIFDTRLKVFQITNDLSTQRSKSLMSFILSLLNYFSRIDKILTTKIISDTNVLKNDFESNDWYNELVQRMITQNGRKNVV